MKSRKIFLLFLGSAFLISCLHASVQKNDKIKNISWLQIHQDAYKLGKKISQLDKKFVKIIAITRGGLIPAGIISQVLNIKDIDTICISSYSQNKQQTHMKIIKELKNYDENILVVDELADSGATLRLVREKMLPNAYFVSLYAKPRGESAVDMFFKKIKQDIWCVLPWETPPK